MKNYTRHITITKLEPTSTVEIVSKKAKKRFFGKRRAFIDKTYNMRYANYDTYEENKRDYYATLQLVFSGKCKNIFEAYKLSHSC